MRLYFVLRNVLCMAEHAAATRVPRSTQGHDGGSGTRQADLDWAGGHDMLGPCIARCSHRLVHE